MKTKLVIFDFDGTLTLTDAGANCWRYIWEEINATEIDDKLYHDYLNGIISYNEWVDKVVKEYRKHNVTQTLIEQISNGIRLREGLDKTFRNLNNNGVKIYVISDGIKNMLDFSLKEVMAYINKVDAINFVFDENGVVKTFLKSTHELGKKNNVINQLLKELKLTPEEVLFVGNGQNDECAHETGVTTLCINPDMTDPYNKDFWDYYIENNASLEEILKFIK